MKIKILRGVGVGHKTFLAGSVVDVSEKDVATLKAEKLYDCEKLEGKPFERDLKDKEIKSKNIRKKGQ